MRIIKSVLSLILLLPLVVMAQSNYLNDPLVRAAFAAYDAQIQADPQNYVAYFGRGKEYFNYKDYNRALDDLNNAIKYYPTKENVDLSQAYTMRGLIYQHNGDMMAALDDFNEALRLDPESRFSLLSRADLLCEMGNYELAKADYQMLLRKNSRNQEAYLGLARVALGEQNIGVCNENLQKAQEVNPSSAGLYLQRAGIYEQMGEYAKAVDDYVLAIVYGESKQSVKAINRLSRKEYNVVVKSLSNVIETVEDKGYFYYLRAIIHQNNYRYTDAINDWNTILKEKYYYFHSIFSNRSYCYMRLGQFEYAMEDISHALLLKKDDISLYLTRAQLNRILGNYEKAAEDISIAMTYNPTSVNVLLQKGLLAAEQGEYESAADNYNEAVMYNADFAYAYLLRGVNYERLENTSAAENNYNMILSLPDDSASFVTLKGFALSRLGRNDEAEEWAETVLQNLGANVSISDYYNAACLYAQTGNNDKAYTYLEKALKGGYGDYYNLYFEMDSPVSLAPLRNESEFRSLVQSYSSSF